MLPMQQDRTEEKYQRPYSFAQTLMNEALYQLGMRIVAEASYSTIHSDFDFETYSEGGLVYDAVNGKWVSLPGLSAQKRGLKAIGVYNYVTHPTFEVLSLAWNLKDGRGVRWWRPNPQIPQRNAPRFIPGLINDYHPQELLDYVAAGGIVEAFNVMFEWRVWNFYCVPVWGWPELPIEQIRCCMAKSKAAGYPEALDDVGIVLKLVNKKDPDGDRLIRKLTMPRNPTKGNPALRWTPFTATEDFEKFYEYNRQDIRTEAEASLKIPDLSPREFEIWKMDFRINARGMQVDLKAVDDCIAIMEQCFLKYNSELQCLTNYTVSNSSEVQKMLEWMARRGVTLYSLDEEALEKALARTDYPKDVLRVLRIRQMLGFGSVKKLYAFRSFASREGRLYDQYSYHGAHTGLWNGRGVQVANLYSGIFKKPEEVERALGIMSTRCLELLEYEYLGTDPLEVVASCLRSMIVAKPGHRLISADFSAIQAVVTSCLANEQWRIDVFRTHGKIYEMQAAMLTGKTLEYYLDYRKQNGKHHEDRQNFGKIPVLSADFGAWIDGWKQFGADKLGDDNYIKQLILKTRAAIPNIVEMWGGQTRNKFNRAPDGRYAEEYAQLYGLEGAAISAILEPGRAFGYRGIVYQMHEDILYCKPPSGGFIRYHSPRLARSEKPYASQWDLNMSYLGWNSNANKGASGWMRMFLYGGVQTQNVVSHESREIQADALLALEARGYPVVMHTHDEQVTEPINGFGSVEDYLETVRGSLPKWAICDDGQPWPIKVPDAWEAPRYGKWET